MGRSYLFGGDTKYLTPAQYQLEQLYDQIDRPGNRVSTADFFKSPDYGRWLESTYGSLADQLPPGSQIINQTPFKIEFKDAEGYTHTLTRQGADAATSGAFTRQTDRPAILPNEQQDDILAQLRQRVQQGLAPATLAALPLDVQAQLDAINSAEQANLNQQATDERGRLVAQLYGNRVNQSSIADEQSARFIEALGRLRGEQSANAASRTLGVRQYLTGLGQQQNEGIANLLANLSGQSTQRDIAGAGLNLDAQRLAETLRQFDKTYGLQSAGLQLDRARLEQENSGFNKFLKTLSAAGALAQGGGTAYRAYKGI